MAIVRTDVIRHAPSDHETGENGKDALSVEPPSRLNGKGLTGELIDDRKHTEFAPVPRSVVDEVIRPDMFRLLRSEPHARSVVEPQADRLRLLLRYAKALKTPDPSYTFVIGIPAVTPEQSSDPAIALETTFARQLDDRRSRRVFDNQILQPAPLRRSVLGHQSANPAF